MTTYLENLTKFPDLRVVILGDLNTDLAAAQAAKYGVPQSGTAADVLAQHDDARIGGHLLLAVAAVLLVALVVAGAGGGGGAHRFGSVHSPRRSSSPVIVSMSRSRRASSSWLAITQR